jgi:hypothetical protein
MWEISTDLVVEFWNAKGKARSGVREQVEVVRVFEEL